MYISVINVMEQNFRYYEPLIVEAGLDEDNGAVVLKYSDGSEAKAKVNGFCNKPKNTVISKWDKLKESMGLSEIDSDLWFFEKDNNLRTDILTKNFADTDIEEEEKKRFIEKVNNLAEAIHNEDKNPYKKAVTFMYLKELFFPVILLLYSEFGYVYDDYEEFKLDFYDTFTRVVNIFESKEKLLEMHYDYQSEVLRAVAVGMIFRLKDRNKVKIVMA